MKLYHYTTWLGSILADAGEIETMNRYGFGEMTMLNDWPKLVFLTSNQDWEPSVQAYNAEKYHEKCGSCPEVYAQLGIPCWKLEVDVPLGEVCCALDNRLMTHPKWVVMLKDAMALGSDISRWMVSFDELSIEKAYRWYDGQWRLDI